MRGARVLLIVPRRSGRDCVIAGSHKMCLTPAAPCSHVHLRSYPKVAPNSSGPSSALEAKIAERFGSVAAMKEEMSAMSVGVQGSGWGWLAYNPKSKSMEIATCANQDPLEATTGLKPLLGIDVWEHAYYLDYKNLRPKYVGAIWDVINWDTVEARLNAASK